MSNLFISASPYSLKLRRNLHAAQGDPNTREKEVLGRGVIVFRRREEKVRQAASVDRKGFDESIPNYSVMLRLELASVEGRPCASQHLVLIENVFRDCS